MESTAPSPSRPATFRRVVGAFAVVAFLLYAALLITHVSANAGGSDSSGYMNHARLLGTGRVHSPPHALPGLNADDFSDFLYIPLGFVPRSGQLVPSYPVGMPLMILAAHWLAGWNHACDLVIVTHSLAALLLVFSLGRVLGFSERASLLVVVVLAASPLFLMYSLQAMTDTPAVAWTCATALCLWRSRQKVGWSVLAGLACGISVLLRPNNVIMLLPAVVVWWPRWGDANERRQLGRQILGFGLGGLPTAVVFVLHSHAAYGHWLTTGYGDPSQLFQRSLIPVTLHHYVQWLPVAFSCGVGLFALLPLIGWRSRQALFLVVWGLVYLAFYVSYYWTSQAWWYLRFVLPAAPAYLFGALWAARWLWDRVLRARVRHFRFNLVPLAYLVAGALLLRNELHWNRKFQVLATGHGERAYETAIDWLRQHAPANAVLEVMQLSGAAYYYSDFIALRWDQMTAANFPEVTAAAARENRPIYAPLFPFEKERALTECMPGQWELVGQIREIMIYRWAGRLPSSGPAGR